LYGLLDVVNYLVKQGVDINQTDQYGETALFYAMSALDEKMIEKLIQYGVDVNIENEKKRSFIDRIIRDECSVSVKFIMQYFDKFNEKNQKKLKKIRLKNLVERGITHE